MAKIPTPKARAIVFFSLAGIFLIIMTLLYLNLEEGTSKAPLVGPLLMCFSMIILGFAQLRAKR